MLGLDDVNADGVRDYAIGATHSYTQKGYVRIYSGATHALLNVIWGEVVYAQLGYALAQCDDLNGDGVRDILVGAPFAGAGTVFACSPVTGQRLWEKSGQQLGDALGASVAGMGDYNGDGLGDALVGAPLSDHTGTDSGQVFVLSGATGTRVAVLTGFAAGDEAGQAVSVPGDVNGDGVVDLAVGAPGADPGGRTGAGSVHVFSGASLAPLIRADGPLAGDAMGTALAAAGDCNADGTPDFIAGADLAEGGGKSSAGSALVCSGAALPLRPDTTVVSAASGGRVEFTLDLGAGAAGRSYWLLGSATGVAPGLDVGSVHLPLNNDIFFQLVMSWTNTSVFDGFLGSLDGAGQASPAFDTLAPFDPALAGLQLRFAALLLGPIDTVTNAVPVELMP